MSLDHFVLGVSIGIGRSIAEAESALFKAKERKNQAQIGPYSVRDNPPYYIQTYQGEERLDKTEIDPRIEDYLVLLRFLEEKGPEHIDTLEKLVKLDIGTTALTPLGYRIEKHLRETEEVQQSRRPREAQRYVILLDVNDMKYWNETMASYEAVTEHLNVIGATLVKDCRTEKNGHVDFVGQLQPLVNRLHGDAGDEFLIDLYCPEEFVEIIAERLVKAVYKAQREMNC